MSENKKRVAVIYKSKYGSTKRYAEWIANEVGGDLFEGSRVKVTELRPYDTIVFGGALYAVGILGFSFFKKHFEQLKDKKLVVFAVGASPARKDAMDHVFHSNLTDEMKEKVKFFMLRGAFDFKKLNLIDKLLMSLLKLKIKRTKEEDRDADSKGMLASYDRPVDWTNKKAIQPIVEYIRGD